MAVKVDCYFVKLFQIVILFQNKINTFTCDGPQNGARKVELT